MKTGNNRPLYLLIALLTLIFLAGCSTAGDIYDMGTDVAKQFTAKLLPDQKPLLKKRVLVGPVIDMAGLNDAIAANIKEGWVHYLGKDKYIRIIASEQDIMPYEKRGSSPYGIYIDHEHLKRAEETGMNVFVSTILHPVTVDIKKTGIWPFRNYTKIIELSMSVNAIDINSNTLIISDEDSKKRKIEKQVDPDAVKEWETDYDLVKENVISMIKDFSETIRDSLIQYPWQGQISITADKKIRINGGEDIGVVEGNVFEVFEKGNPIKSLTDREYFILGRKAGEMRITSVAGKYSEGAALNNAQFEEGQIVRIKR